MEALNLIFYQKSNQARSIAEVVGESMRCSGLRWGGFAE
jgi:hypothetical protein